MSRTRGAGFLANLALLLTTCVLLVLAVETAVRAWTYYEDRKVLSIALKTPRKVMKGQRVLLGHMVRLSGDDRIIYELEKNLDVSFMDAPLTTNSEGFRDKEYPVEKSPGTVRVVGIGDSIMFGQGVTDGKEFLSFLEEELNEKYPQRKWDVINTAVSGYNTVQEVETLKVKGLRYDPDLVVVAFVDNDDRLPNFIRKPEDYFTMDKSFLWEFITRRLHSGAKKISFLMLAPDMLAKTGDEFDYSKVPEIYRNMVGLEACDKAFEDLAALSREHGFDVMVTFFTGGEVSVHAKEKASALGFYIVDIHALYEKYMAEHGIKKQEGSILSISWYDAHPSPFAHKMAAEEILHFMEDAGMIEKYVRSEGEIQ